MASENDEHESLSTDHLLSPTPIGSKPASYEDDSEVESYESFDGTESHSAARTCDSAYSEFEPKGTADGTQLQQQLYEATKKLVVEGEKNVSLALELEKYKDELSMLKRESESFRSALLRGINGGVADSNNYTQVGLDELLRLRIQESASLQPSCSDEASPQPHQFELARNESSVGVIQQLEHKLGLEAQQNAALEAKCLSLKEELEESAKHVDGIDNLRLKVSQMVQRLRTEREVKFKVQRELSVEKDKVEALSDHIEKLMVHLKHEAIAKARSLVDQSRLQRDMETMRLRTVAMGKKNERKDQVIAELRESGKLLEDQLRLMDEKYMELRSKLDWTRSQTERIVKRKEEEVRQLRLKFDMISDKQFLIDDSERETVMPKKQKPKPRMRSSDMGGRKSVIELHKALNKTLRRDGERSSR